MGQIDRGVAFAAVRPTYLWRVAGPLPLRILMPTLTRQSSHSQRLRARDSVTAHLDSLNTSTGTLEAR